MANGNASPMLGPCARCTKPVHANEDTTRWEEVMQELRTGKRTFAGFTDPMHIGCSPSRNQYYGGPRQERYFKAIDAILAPVAKKILDDACGFDSQRECYEDRVKSLTEKYVGQRDDLAQRYLSAKPDYDANLDRLYPEALPAELHPLARAWEHYHMCCWEIRVCGEPRLAQSQSAQEHLANARQLLPGAEAEWRAQVKTWQQAHAPEEEEEHADDDDGGHADG